MRTETIEIMQYHELSDEAKKRAQEWWINGNLTCGYPNDSEWDASWNEFQKSLPAPPEQPDMTGLRLRTWIINNYYPEIEKGKYLGTIHDREVKHRMVKVAKGTIPSVNGTREEWILSHVYSNVQVTIDCPFTGACMDYDCIQPIIDFVNSPNDCDTWSDLLKQCSDNWDEGIEKDHEWQNSEEYIADVCEANEYEFNVNGTRY